MAIIDPTLAYTDRTDATLGKYFTIDQNRRLKLDMRPAEGGYCYVPEFRATCDVCGREIWVRLTRYTITCSEECREAHARAGNRKRQAEYQARKRAANDASGGCVR